MPVVRHPRLSQLSLTELRTTFVERPISHAGRACRPSHASHETVVARGDAVLPPPANAGLGRPHAGQDDAASTTTATHASLACHAASAPAWRATGPEVRRRPLRLG